MRLMYVDEAGLSRQDDEPYTVVAGVVLHADLELSAVEDDIAALVDKHIPADIPSRFVLSAKEIFNGGSTLKRNEGWDSERRYAIATDLTKLIQRSDIRVIIGVVDRASVPDFGMFRNETENAHVAAFSMCYLRCEDWMRKNHPSEIVLMVVEETSSSTALKRMTREHQDRMFVSRLNVGMLPLPLRHIKLDPLFQAKSPHSPLILADYCAYVWKRHLAGKGFYKQFLFPMLGRISAGGE